MSTLVISYSDLEKASKAAKIIAEDLDYYSAHLENDIRNRISTYSGDRTQNICDADYNVQIKKQKLQQKKNDFMTLSNNIDTFKLNCEAADRNVSYALRSITGEFKNSYDVTENIDTNFFCYISIMIGNTKVLGKVLKNNLKRSNNTLEKSSKSIQNWYKNNKKNKSFIGNSSTILIGSGLASGIHKAYGQGKIGDETWAKCYKNTKKSKAAEIQKLKKKYQKGKLTDDELIWALVKLYGVDDYFSVPSYSCALGKKYNPQKKEQLVKKVVEEYIKIKYDKDDLKKAYKEYEKLYAANYYDRNKNKHNTSYNVLPVDNPKKVTYKEFPAFLAKEESKNVVEIAYSGEKLQDSAITFVSSAAYAILLQKSYSKNREFFDYREPDTVPEIEIIKVKPPGSDHYVEVYTDGHAQVNKNKIKIYIRGKIKKPAKYKKLKSRIEELENIKKYNASEFTPAMREEMGKCERAVHNYDRSKQMGKLLKDAGIKNTTKNNELIAKEILNAAKEVRKGNTIVECLIKGKKKTVLIESRWIIDKDGTPYCSTIILKAVK
ncbi:hypothetical protein [Anaeromicropila herbilytica]|uniref:Uncharacterized protein n=1 Tax=Anaeromicropila herbilytica TaxID=2785025 RepID=A0A7R7IFS1_9FIRM|nr:hypothetical protein [Anaeromicropila herbilytica]BCN32363.1 hypothetical protein bsdtb5_36580 [Anaeromicropila herbilytica]